MLLVPGDAHTGAFGEDELELHAQDARGTRWGGHFAASFVGLLFGDDELEDEVVMYGKACGGVHVAEGRWAQRGVACGGEFHLNLAAVGVKVRLPAAAEVFAPNRARFLV